MSHLRSLCLPVAAFLLVFGSTVAHAEGLPSSSVPPREIRAAGEPLAALLPRIGELYGVGLSPAAEVRGQRITLYVNNLSLEDLSRGIVELLSAGPEEPVLWEHTRQNTWRLAESLNRRKLVARLQGQDIASYSRLLDEQIAWAKGDGAKALAGASGSQRDAYQEKLTHGLLLDSLGEAGRQKLLSGDMVYFRVGEMAAPLRDLFRERVCRQFVMPDAPVDEIDGQTVVYLFGRNPTDPQGSRLFVSVVSPAMRGAARFTLFTPPNPRVLPATWGVFELPPRPGGPADGAVKVNLSPEPKGSKAPYVSRNLDQVLEAIAHDTGVQVIADGYLRARLRMPPNMIARDWPIERLLDQFCYIWGCRWHYLGTRHDVVYVRSENWWLEDAADVPESDAKQFKESFGAGRESKLTDLLRLAELTDAQVHKLEESGICPGAQGVIHEGWYEPASSAKPWLQFFSRLPAPLQAQAQAAEGLPLRAAPEGLVQTWLMPSLVAGIGAVTGEARRGLIFSLTPVAHERGYRSGYDVSVRRPDGSRWSAIVGYREDIADPIRPE